MAGTIWLDFLKIAFGCLLGLSAGLIAPFAQRWLTRLFLGPKLVGELDVDEVPAIAGNQSTPRCYFRIKLKNLKPHVARECRGYITRIEKVGSHGPFQALLNETFQLAWSYDDKRVSFDLPFGPAFTIDVAVFERGEPDLFPMHAWWRPSYKVQWDFHFNRILSIHSADSWP